jgi:hypothetical protein
MKQKKKANLTKQLLKGFVVDSSRESQKRLQRWLQTSSAVRLTVIILCTAEADCYWDKLKVLPMELFRRFQ